MRLPSLLATSASVLIASALAAPALTPPPATVGPAVDRYFGTELADPYRALEDVAAPETQQWMKAASAHAESVLAAIPGRDALLTRIVELEAATSARIGRVLRVGGDLWVYERRGADENQFKIVMRQGLAGAERVLVDPAALSKQRGGVPVAVNHFAPSPDGRWLAYGVSERGSEATVLHLLDARTGSAVGAPITRADFGVARWAPDSRRFAFNRLKPEGGDRLTKYQGSAAWLLEVGQGEAQARELLGPATRSIVVPASETPTVLFTADGRWLIGLLEDGVRREARVAIARASDLAGGRAPLWRVVIEPSDGVTDFAYARGTLYAATHKDAPRFRFVAAPIDKFGAATARTVVGAGERVLGMMVAARDALYFEAREGNAKQLWKLAYTANAKPVRVALPVQGSFALRRGAAWGANAALDGVVFALESSTRAPQIYAVDRRGAVRNTGLQPAGPFDAPADLVATDALVPSPDGVRVPITVIHKKGLPRDANAPTWMLGYAAYGFTMEPRFFVNNLAWFERGGVLAIVNPRGSGVFGQAWYEAGKQATKPNTWRDMIAAAEWLVAERYTRPGRLAIEGGSAGGITSGRAATERPDLFAAVVPRVGALDTVRMELEPNGPPNIPEFGTHKTEAGFKALLAMSTYHAIRDGVRYPAVLLTHGVNDPRVAVWQSSKTAARMAAVSAALPAEQGRPVLLRLDYDAGHGVGNTRTQSQRERADVWAFMLWQMGVEGFQPASK